MDTGLRRENVTRQRTEATRRILRVLDLRPPGRVNQSQVHKKSLKPRFADQ